MSRGNSKVRVVLLTGVPIREIYKVGVIYIEKVVPEILCDLLHKHDYISYIGHASTAVTISKLCGTVIPVNRGEWNYQSNDLPIAIVLRRRPQGDENISIDDLEFYAVLPLQPCGTYPSATTQAWLDAGGLMPPCIAAP